MCIGGPTKKNDGIGLLDVEMEGDGYWYQEEEGVEIYLQSATNKTEQHGVGCIHDPKSAVFQP